MGIREFDAICEVTSRARATTPDSWEGYEQDPFWQDAHRRQS